MAWPAYLGRYGLWFCVWPGLFGAHLDISCIRDWHRSTVSRSIVRMMKSRFAILWKASRRSMRPSSELHESNASLMTRESIISRSLTPLLKAL